MVPARALVSLLVTIAMTAVAVADPLLVAPESNGKAVDRLGGVIADCVIRGGWTEPTGWKTWRTSVGLASASPDGDAILVRTRARRGRPDDGQAIARAIVDAPLTFEAPQVETKRKDRWWSRTTTRGTATVRGEPVEVAIVRVGRGYGRDAVWIEVAAGANREAALRAMAAARDSAKPYPSHACVCCTDCDTREAARACKSANGGI